MAFGTDTILLSEDGCRLIDIADLKEGDRIFGPTGKVLTILSLINQAASPLYRVNYDDSWYRVTGDHVLNLIAGTAMRNPITGSDMYLGETFNISVEDYLAQSEDFRRKVFGYRSILSFPATNPGFPPYEYGVILSHNRFMDGLIQVMKMPGVRIPRSYLCNSVDIRQLLLGGYIDGNGKDAYKGGRLRLRIGDETLRSDFMFLVKSLGLTAYCTDDDVLEVLGKLGNVHTEVVKMSNDNAQPYYPIEIEPDGEGETIGIEVKEDDKLLMLGDFSVVHI